MCINFQKPQEMLIIQSIRTVINYLLGCLVSVVFDGETLVSCVLTIAISSGHFCVSMCNILLLAPHASVIDFYI